MCNRGLKPTKGNDYSNLWKIKMTIKNTKFVVSSK